MSASLLPSSGYNCNFREFTIGIQSFRAGQSSSLRRVYWLIESFKWSKTFDTLKSAAGVKILLFWCSLDKGTFNSQKHLWPRCSGIKKWKKKMYLLIKKTLADWLFTFSWSLSGLALYVFARHLIYRVIIVRYQKELYFRFIYDKRNGSLMIFLGDLDSNPDITYFFMVS